MGGHPDRGATLNGDALAFRDAVAIGVAAPAPAFALAATLGLVVATAGAHAPAVLLLAAVPMLCIAIAFAELNRVDPDCGTAYSWSRRELGPAVGFAGGWAIVVASVVVLGILVNTAALYLLLLLGIDGATVTATALGALMLVAVTAFSVRGVELSGRASRLLVALQLVALVLLAVVALANADAGSPQLSWFSPFALDGDALLDALIVAIFLYWGWDCAVFVAEETRDGAHAAGRAGIAAVGVLVAIYVLVITALLAHGGTALGDLDATAADVLGSPLDKLVVLAVCLSSLASAQVTVLAQARTMLAMARNRDLPGRLAHIHARERTPDRATLWAGALGLTWYVSFTAISDDVLADSLLATGLFVVFVHALVGVACVARFRHALRSSPRAFVLMGVLPLTGA
ncbi:MAG TPA: APC family permease, partial [Solirubrobacteraceae bacterium]